MKDWQPNPDVVKHFASKGAAWWKAEHEARMERERLFDEAVRAVLEDGDPDRPKSAKAVG